MGSDLVEFKKSGMDPIDDTFIIGRHDGGCGSIIAL